MAVTMPPTFIRTKSWAEKTSGVPHQPQQILANWIFLSASIMLLCQFAALQNVLLAYQQGMQLSYMAMLLNWFGTVSCILWLLGFIILLHWLIRIHATLGSIIATSLKVLASFFFNLQPATAIGGTSAGLGFWWSNLVGILLFHIGNLISCTDFWINPPIRSEFRRGPFYYGNLPVNGMWQFQLATWLLVAANLMSCNWGGQTPSASWLLTSHVAVQVCQYSGAILLITGSFTYLLWCDGFRTAATGLEKAATSAPTEPSPLKRLRTNPF